MDIVATPSMVLVYRTESDLHGDPPVELGESLWETIALSENYMSYIGFIMMFLLLGIFIGYGIHTLVSHCVERRRRIARENDIVAFTAQSFDDNVGVSLLGDHVA
nr:hypothetical protein [Salmonid herpesvirus 1]